MVSEETSAGVYFLGNDRVLDWSIGLLESLRFHNPDIPLALIHYDDRICQIAALTSKYQFTIFSGPTLAIVDEEGHSLNKESKWSPAFR